MRERDARSSVKFLWETTTYALSADQTLCSSCLSPLATELPSCDESSGFRLFASPLGGCTAGI